MVEQEMVKVETWILCLIDEETHLPRFYYNRIENIFETNFSNQCTFLDEKSSLDEQLNIVG